jgi:hypothetical protein
MKAEELTCSKQHCYCPVCQSSFIKQKEEGAGRVGQALVAGSLLPAISMRPLRSNLFESESFETPGVIVMQRGAPVVPDRPRR